MISQVQQSRGGEWNLHMHPSACLMLTFSPLYRFWHGPWWRSAYLSQSNALSQQKHIYKLLTVLSFLSLEQISSTVTIYIIRKCVLPGAQCSEVPAFLIFNWIGHYKLQLQVRYFITDNMKHSRCGRLKLSIILLITELINSNCSLSHSTNSHEF